MSEKAQKMRVLVTGGPTRAYLDRVRYLSNHSTGATAFELCQGLLQKGAEVALVTGPTCQEWTKLSLCRLDKVETNAEMYQAVMRLCRSFKPDVVVFAAAVLDFAPAITRPGKTSSTATQKAWVVTLKPTPKIIDEVRGRFPKVKRVAFKLEWKRETIVETKRHALRYLKKKGVDVVCLNYLSEIKGTKHPALLLSKEGDSFRAKSKSEIAAWIADYITR